MDLNAYDSFITENIGQSVRHLNEIQRPSISENNMS